MSWQPGESGNPSGRKNGTLNPMRAKAVREHIQAVQLIRRLQFFALDEVDPTTAKRVEMTGEQVKAACYLISQRIGSPPKEITGQVSITANVVVAALVARLGSSDKARQALEAIQAPGLSALLPSLNGELIEEVETDE